MSKGNELRKYLLSALSGVLIILSFPNFNLSGLAWFALVPLLVAINGTDWKSALRFGFITGIIYFGGVMIWLMTLIPYSTIFWVSLGYIVLSLYLSCYVFIFTVAVSIITEYWNRLTIFSKKISFFQPLSYSFLVAVIWTGLEILRGHVASGLPWAGFGSTQWMNPPIIQISSIFGAYGVTFLIALINGAIASFIIDLNKWKASLKAISICLGIFVACLIYGFISLNVNIDGEKIKVAMIPGNIRQDEKMASWGEKSSWIFEKYFDLTLKAVEEKPDIIVWPETAVPKFIFPDSPERDRLRIMIPIWNTYFLMGTISAEYEEKNWKIYNSVFLLSPNAEIIDKYHKMHLVPVSESFPLKKYLPKKLHDLVVGVSDFDSGNRYTVFSAPPAKIGVPICFESVFPEISRNFVRYGANVICMVTNDAWFVGTHAAYQHFSMAPLRAVENRTAVFRCANYGVSCIIDPYGRILKRIDPDDNVDYLAGEVSLNYGGSFYTKHGDLLPWTCLVVTLFFIFRVWFYERSKITKAQGGTNAIRDALSDRRNKKQSHRSRRSSLTSKTKKMK